MRARAERSLAAGVARALGFHLLDSGALYRLVALKASKERIALDTEARLAAEVEREPANLDEIAVAADDEACCAGTTLAIRHINTIRITNFL